MQVEKTNDVFLQLSEELQKCKKPKKDIVLPELFGIQYKEVYLTQWLAYLLSLKNDGVRILNALLTAANVPDLVISENITPDVNTEYVFQDGRRIDILLTAGDVLIGIENKIFAEQGENQTDDYQKSLKQLSEQLGINRYFGIYLRPNFNKSNSKYFYNATYGDFHYQLKQLQFDWLQSRTASYIWEFIRYVEAYLMEDFPEMTEAAKVYNHYWEQFAEAQADFSNYTERFHKWIQGLLESKECGLHTDIFSATNHYWCISKNAEWKNIRFHFEVIWRGELCRAKTIGLEAHIEGAKGRDDALVRQAFGIPANNKLTCSTNNPLEHLEIPCDFSDKQAAENSLQTIIDTFLMHPDFVKRSEQADAYLQMKQQKKT